MLCQDISAKTTHDQGLTIGESQDPKSMGSVKKVNRVQKIASYISMYCIDVQSVTVTLGI